MNVLGTLWKRINRLIEVISKSEMGKRAWKVVYLLIECSSINKMSEMRRVEHDGSIKALAKSEMSEGEWE
jgi:hypothetical protein